MSTKALRAGGTIRRCRFVKGGAADHTVIEADANDRILGIADEPGREAPIPSVTADPPEAALVDDSVRIFFAGETCQIELSATIARFSLVKSDADGKAVILAETAGLKEECGAMTLESGLNGELVRCIVRPQTLTTET